MWFNVVLGSFLKSDHLFNLIILAGYAERSPKYALILKQPFDITQNLIDNFFFLTLTVRRPSHREDFKWKKYGSTLLISEKTETLYVELKERPEAATNNFYSIYLLINHA